jgi:hypothetical protein
MNVNDALAAIQSDSVAMDILFGNSPKDMAIRAMENKELHSVAEYLEKNLANIDFVLVSLRVKLTSLDMQSSLPMLGTVTAYFEILRNFPSDKVLEVFSRTIAGLNPDNFLRQVLTFQLANIKDTQGNLTIESPKEPQEVLWTTTTSTAGVVTISLN